MEDLLLTLHFYCISLPPSTNIDPRFITRIALVAEGVRGGEARNKDGFVEIFKTIMDVGTDISETIINLDSRHKFAWQLSQLSNIVNSTAISDCPIRCGYHTIRPSLRGCSLLVLGVHDFEALFQNQEVGRRVGCYFSLNLASVPSTWILPQKTEKTSRSAGVAFR